MDLCRAVCSEWAHLFAGKLSLPWGRDILVTWNSETFVNYFTQYTKRLTSEKVSNAHWRVRPHPALYHAFSKYLEKLYWTCKRYYTDQVVRQLFTHCQPAEYKISCGLIIGIIFEHRAMLSRATKSQLTHDLMMLC